MEIKTSQNTSLSGLPALGDKDSRTIYFGELGLTLHISDFLALCEALDKDAAHLYSKAKAFYDRYQSRREKERMAIQQLRRVFYDIDGDWVWLNDDVDKEALDDALDKCSKMFGFD